MYLAVLAGVALVGCTKNERTTELIDSQKEISFTPVVANTTKAPQPGEIAATYNHDESFKVFGFYCEEADYNPANATVYMNNIKCVYDGDIHDGADVGDGAWKPESIYYWPKNGKLTFSAYSPADATATTIKCDATTGLEIAGFAVDANVAKQYDLLYSDRAYNKTTSIGETNPNYDGVDIVFHHALSSIHVNVKSADDYSGAITINSVSILNAYFKGTFKENLTAAKETDSRATSSWSSPESEIDEFIIGNANAVLTETPVQYGTTALLLPQEFDHGAKHVKLQVKYTIKNGDDTTLPQVSTFDLTTEANTGEVGGVPSTFTQWVKGYRYTYNITIGLDKVYFAPSVDVWDDATITVPQI